MQGDILDWLIIPHNHSSSNAINLAHLKNVSPMATARKKELNLRPASGGPSGFIQHYLRAVLYDALRMAGRAYAMLFGTISQSLFKIMEMTPHYLLY